MSQKIILIQSKSIFALKAVNLYHLGEKSKNDLIREIVFLEKLKNCDGVVKVIYWILKRWRLQVSHILIRLMTMNSKRHLTVTGCMFSWKKVTWIFTRWVKYKAVMIRNNRDSYTKSTTGLMYITYIYLDFDKK